MSSAIGCLSSIFAVLVLVAYVITLAVFYGMFTFGGYEKWGCYASQDSDINEPWDD